MPASASLIAWIENRCERFVAAYVGSDAPGRAPAIQLCCSADEARRWVETEAKGLGVPIQWVEQRLVR